ncbi:type VI secretion system Vgr family protein [Tenacibaculum maritimum]|uniref:type VI secretion system Vgr family protein n=1 Tax=Tenacibaculum maritimum TaxID=107401 RepID=UPI0012E5CDBF|nr:phage baseplate assembly protein V [Tenacibaculum maritimum]MCD9564112.1 phage baseplate assembly protein V [Tenacibaculum maritimum]MCD9567011.1 phage baseplate assembly protein V [Tenacibaculum maritimum]MCD9580258.1 phage baseplate assembly protein V [Tenacibaculum maritimum]MCD9597966.1 phage baseplate assembly protein V [Tenacibaculum maritimum]MCD9614897.1 phage baseplate assembly protein V [Tenacibaculum maritimum]
MLKRNPCRISIDGVSIDRYVSLKLVQKINAHHTFEVALDNEIFLLTKGTDIFSSKEYIGKSIYIEIEKYDFLGRITAMDFEMSKGEYGHTLLKGYSKTILLESGDRLKSWTDKAMPQIVKSILEESGMRGMIAPETDFPIPYQCQYNESDFRYLQRLAKQYHEWFYYEGEYIVFGKPKEGKSCIDLEYNKEVYEVKIATKTAAVSQRAYDFSYRENKMLETPAKNDKVTSAISEYALNAAIKLYPKKTLGMPETVLGDKYEMDRYLLGKTESILSEFDVLEAKSKFVGLEIGSVIRLTSKEKHVGDSYLITEITHTEGQGREYENEFKAIAANSRYLPEPKITPAIAGTQRAIVVDHEDPLEQGRVKVKMLWQENEMTTNWIQVLAPDAGNSDVVEKNRGYVFIPEEGDQVLIGFHHNDPNRPFVLGSLHHSDSAGGGKKKNSVKSLKTRSGHTIELDDTKGKEKIHIYDNGGSIITFDTKKKSLYIQATENLELAAKNIKIAATENIRFHAQENIESVSEIDTVMMANTALKLQSTENTSIKSSSNLQMEASNKATLKAVATSLEGSSEVSLQGNTAKVNGDSITEISGGIVKIN